MRKDGLENLMQKRHIEGNMLPAVSLFLLVFNITQDRQIFQDCFPHNASPKFHLSPDSNCNCTLYVNILNILRTLF